MTSHVIVNNLVPCSWLLSGDLEILRLQLRLRACISVSNTALYTQPARSQLLSSPIDTIAKIGHRVELECSTNATTQLIWRFKGVNSTQFELIYLNGQIALEFWSRYKVNTTVNGRWDLVIDSVTGVQAGTYRCENTE